MEQTVLEEWLEAKAKEREAKETRIAIEEKILEYAKPILSKNSTTFREGNLKVEIKLNRKYKIREGFVPPENVDIYETKISDTKLKAYSGEEWVCEIENKPTINIVREV